MEYEMIPKGFGDLRIFFWCPKNESFRDTFVSDLVRISDNAVAFSYVWKITFSKQIGNEPSNPENTLEDIKKVPINDSFSGGIRKVSGNECFKILKYITY